jgi:peptide/nickel transport system permease protein
VLAFVVRRTLATLVVLLAITILVFLIFFHTPGVDPARKMAGRNPSPATISAIKHAYGLDRPLPVQYVILMKKLFISRDLTSYTNQGELVVPTIVAATPVTLSLVLGAAIIWVVVAVVMGLAAAVLRGTVFDPILMVIALVGISMPVFWLGEMANLVTQSRYHDTFLFSWVPPLGYTPFASDPFMWLKHLVIPWLVLSALYIGLYARVLRAELLENEHEDYVRTARAKGLSERRVLLRHTLRTSMITFVSLFGLDFGVLVGGGALLAEVVFGLPGVGLLTYQSLTSLDLPVIMATVIYGAFFIVLVNAMVDVAYAWLDPRVRPA